MRWNYIFQNNRKDYMYNQFEFDSINFAMNKLYLRKKNANSKLGQDPKEQSIIPN
jgi:hypothetical protein